jgi:hypothetical protein
MPIQNNTTRLECDGALSDLILQAAREVMPAIIAAEPVPNCSVRNQPLLPLLKGLLDGGLVTARAIADNAWDESRPMDRALMHDLANQARAIASAIESASDCPDARGWSLPSMTGKELV